MLALSNSCLPCVSLDCSQVMLWSYLECLGLYNALCDACTTMGSSVMHFSGFVPIGQAAHDCTFSPEGKGHWTVTNLQNHRLLSAPWGGHRVLSCPWITQYTLV